MATTQENQKALQDLYTKAVTHRICKSKKEFAELVGTSRQGLSSAMNGDPSYATDSLVVRATRALEGACANISMVNSDQASGNTQKNFGTDAEDIRHIVDRLVDEMKAQRESYERLLTIALQNGQK